MFTSFLCKNSIYKTNLCKFIIRRNTYCIPHALPERIARHASSRALRERPRERPRVARRALDRALARRQRHGVLARRVDDVERSRGERAQVALDRFRPHHGFHGAAREATRDATARTSAVDGRRPTPSV